MTARNRGGFAALVRQDLLMAYRNGLLLAAAVLSILLILVVDFAVPKTARLAAREYVVDLTEDRFVAEYLSRAGIGQNVLDSEATLLSVLKKDKMSVGIVLKGDRAAPTAVIYSQGNEPPGAMKALDAALAALLGQAAGRVAAIYYEEALLRPESSKPDFNKSLVPVILATEVTTLGYLFIAVMVFQEKTEGSIKAYRVSPQGVWPYVAAKTVSNTLLATGYGAVILLFTVGPRAGTLPVLGLVALAALLLSALGLAVSVFFEDLSGFLYPAITLFLAFGLPVTAYFFPALQVPGMELIPSYPLAFGIRELLFPTGKIGFYLPMSLTLAAEAAVFLVASAKAVEKRLMKEAK